MEQHLQTVIEQGILPLTSACNTACLFCSHRFNPPGLQIFRQEPLPPAAVAEFLPTIRRLPSLTIGESVTTTIEGEPLTHPDFLEILRAIRQSVPELLLKITSNGILLTEQLLQALCRLQPLELTISLNSVDPSARRQLMGDRAGDIRPLLPRLRQSGLPWHASLVAMPQVVGQDDVLQTADAAAANGARTIRVFWPGFTRQTPPELCLSADLKQRMELRLLTWADRHQTPLLLEPVRLTDLRADVAGVIAATPAARAGVRRGDVILAVDGRPVSSRSEAFQLVAELAGPELKLERQGVPLRLRLDKPAASVSGLVMYSDLSPGVLSRLERHCRRSRGTTVVLTSHLASRQLRAALTAARLDHVSVLTVPNHTFGGSIACAGLLTVRDFARVLAAIRPAPDLVLLPSAPFDQRGCDLEGAHHRQLADYCRRLVVV